MAMGQWIYVDYVGLSIRDVWLKGIVKCIFFIYTIESFQTNVLDAIIDHLVHGSLDIEFNLYLSLLMYI